MLIAFEKSRYSPQISFKSIGKPGQLKLSHAKAAIVGMGGLGSVIAMILCRAGVGYLRLIDRDVVELNNLHRQVLFGEEDVGKLKAVASGARLKKINSAIKIDALADDLNEKNAANLLSGIGIILDGTDNMEARMVINRFAVKNKIPFIYGSAVQDKGMVTLIIPGKTPCLNCIFHLERDEKAESEQQRSDRMFPKLSEELALDCGISGVLPTITGLIGTIEANEAIKYIAGFGEALAGKLFCADLSENKFEFLKVKRNLKCDVCEATKL